MRNASPSQTRLPEDPFAAAGYSDHPACAMARMTGDQAFELSPAEQVRIARLKSDRQQRELRGSLILRRELIARLTGCDPGEVSLTATADGAPELIRPAGWCVSLANTRDVTTVALARAPAELGVDIEIVRDVNWQPILSMICNEADRESLTPDLAAHPDGLRAFFRLWTLKEAVLKSTRRGFRAGPKAIETPMDILSAQGAGELSAFGSTYRFWCVDVGELVVSLVERRL